MHKQLLLSTLLFMVPGVPLLIFASPERRAHYEMKQFVNTSDAIWTYKTTHNGGTTCEYDKMESITLIDIKYKRRFLLRQRRCEIPLRGQFYHFNPEQMTVTSRDMQQLCTEILRFLAGDLSCAVVKVKSITERGKSRYDLRVRNSSLVRAKPQAECTRHFRRAVKGGMAYHVYSSRCQRVFKTFK
uniref:Lipocalin n=1 Tax=Rhipicephalus zambeziensis TaxID=60191 RepID=A0A224YL16_9ACAR